MVYEAGDRRRGPPPAPWSSSHNRASADSWGRLRTALIRRALAFTPAPVPLPVQAGNRPGSSARWRRRAGGFTQRVLVGAWTWWTRRMPQISRLQELLFIQIPLKKLGMRAEGQRRRWREHRLWVAGQQLWRVLVLVRLLLRHVDGGGQGKGGSFRRTLNSIIPNCKFSLLCVPADSRRVSHRRITFLP